MIIGVKYVNTWNIFASALYVSQFLRVIPESKQKKASDENEIIKRVKDRGPLCMKL